MQLLNDLDCQQQVFQPLNGNVLLCILGIKTAEITPVKQILILVKFPILAQGFPPLMFSIAEHLLKWSGE